MRNTNTVAEGAIVEPKFPLNIKTDEQADAAREHAVIVRRRLRGIEDEFRKVSTDYGIALALRDGGDTSRQSDVDRLNMRRTELEDQRDQQEMILGAIASMLNTYTTTVRQREAIAAVPESERLYREGRALEELYANQLLAVAHTAVELNNLVERYALSVRSANFVKGLDDSEKRRLKFADGLLPAVTLNPDAFVSEWVNRHRGWLRGAPPREDPTVQLTEFPTGGQSYTVIGSILTRFMGRD